MRNISNGGGRTLMMIKVHMTMLLKGRYMSTLRFVLGVIMLNTYIPLFSQNRTIYVLDTENHSVPGAKLKVDFQKKSIEGVTNDKGEFRFELQDDSTSNRAKVSVQNYLYTPVDTVIDFSCPANPQIILKPIDLNEVEVIGYKKIARENAEKTVFQINTKGLLKTAKADIALKRIPNVVYSDGDFYLTGGRKKAKILVNGLEVSEQELSKIDAKDIEKVELYKVGLNDDRHSGEIRILLKKDRSVLYKGEAEMGANLLNPGVNFTPSFTYRSKKIDFLTWASYANEHQKNRYRINRNGKDVYSSVNKNHLQQYSASSRVNIFFSPKWMSSLSYSCFGYGSPADVSWQSEGVEQPGKKVKESYYSNFANLIIRHDLKANERFFVKARYFNYKSKNKSSLPVTNFRGRMNELTGDLLYESDSLSLFRRWHSLAVGYKSIYRNSTLTSSDKKYISYVQQFYAKDYFALNDVWDFFILMRSEWDGYKFEKSKYLRKFSFLPSVTLNYKSRIGNLSATYTRSVERPGVDYLNPEVFYINDFTQVKGNPNIKSQYTDKYSINYSRQIKDSYLTAIVSFEKVDNLIDQIYSNDHNTSTYENTGNEQTLQFNLAYNKPLLSNALNINFSAGGGYTIFNIASEFSDKVLTKEHHGWSFTTSTNLSYMMPKDWFANLSMNYINKDIRFNAVYHKKPIFNLLLTKSLLHNNLDISLQYIDMFGFFKKQRIEYCFKDMHQISTYRLPTSRLYLSLVFRFGKQFRSRNVGRTITNEDITTK